MAKKLMKNNKRVIFSKNNDSEYCELFRAHLKMIDAQEFSCRFKPLAQLFQIIKTAIYKYFSKIFHNFQERYTSQHLSSVAYYLTNTFRIFSILKLLLIIHRLRL